MFQMSFDDMKLAEKIQSQPGRTAFIDECGSFGFDFNATGTSEYYILCAVVVKNSEIDLLHRKIADVKNNNGFGNTEMKSSAIGNSYKRRSKIIAELLPINFRIALLVANKKAFVEGSPLTEYKKSFIKFLHQRLYNLLYSVYPKLKIIEDETGSSEFQLSFREYVEKHRPEYNLLDEYDFEYTDSKDSLLVQLADIIGGTINKSFMDVSSPNYVEMLKGKILCLDEFPNKDTPCFADSQRASEKYDKDIFALALRCANNFVKINQGNDNFEKRMQVAFLKYLLFQVLNVDAKKYISSVQLLSILNECADRRVSRDYLYRRVIAPLRDAGVLLASCAQGYKIPISADDVITYLNQTHTIVSPMLHRMGICRNLIKQQSENDFDVLDDTAFLRYKKYFD